MYMYTVLNASIGMVTWNYTFGPFQILHCASTQTLPVQVQSTDKVALLGEELSQPLQGSVIPEEDEIALLKEQMKEQYSFSKCIGHLIVIHCCSACHVLFSCM